MKFTRFSLAAVAALIVGAFAPAANAACAPGNCWGGIAYGPGGAYGYAYDYSARDEPAQWRA